MRRGVWRVVISVRTASDIHLGRQRITSGDPDESRVDRKHDDRNKPQGGKTQSDAQHDGETQRELQSSHVTLDAERQRVAHERAVHRMQFRMRFIARPNT